MGMFGFDAAVGNVAPIAIQCGVTGKWGRLDRLCTDIDRKHNTKDTLLGFCVIICYFL